MKLKSHSGLKKRLRIKKSGMIVVKKPCKNHLLSNKSKRQKRLFRAGMPADVTRMESLRKLMPGRVVLMNRPKVVDAVAPKIN